MYTCINSGWIHKENRLIISIGVTTLRIMNGVNKGLDGRKHVNVTTHFLLSEGLLLLDVLFHPLELATVRH